MSRSSDFSILSTSSWLLVLLVCSGACTAPRRCRLERVERWWCYYGTDRRVLAAERDLLILEADGIGYLSETDKDGRCCLAYLSVGEMATWRPTFRSLRGRTFVLDPNPHWPESRLVDLRAPGWQEHVVTRAAELISLGYDGLFLDNLDTVETLERADPRRWAGMAAAAFELVSRIRRHFPDVVLMANGGASFAGRLAYQVDAHMQESVGHTYDFETGAYRPLNPTEREAMRDRLSRYEATGLPVFALDYAGSDADRAAMAAALRDRGLVPAVATISLKRLPPELLP